VDSKKTILQADDDIWVRTLHDCLDLAYIAGPRAGNLAISWRTSIQSASDKFVEPLCLPPASMLSNAFC